MAPPPSFRYREHAPAPVLRQSVACYWTLEADETPGHRVLPDGCMDLLFDFVSGEHKRGVLVIGAMTHAIVAAPRARRELLGVRFRPGEAFTFLGIPAREGRDRVIALDEVWGRVAAELYERMIEAPDTSSRLRILDHELAARRAYPIDPRLRRAVDGIRATRGGMRVAELAARAGLGERQLERLFDERVGVGPKTLAKVARVQALLGELRSGAGWSTLAAHLGWSDQSHLVRDLRELAGVTPTELARAVQMSDSSNTPHGPLATKDPP